MTWSSTNQWCQVSYGSGWNIHVPANEALCASKNRRSSPSRIVRTETPAGHAGSGSAPFNSTRIRYEWRTRP